MGIVKKTLLWKSFLLSGFLFCQVAVAQQGYGIGWHVVKLGRQKAFPKTVPAGNYSGITHLYDDIYAVVSDKSDSALYFRFKIQIDGESGELRRVENLGFTEYVDGSVKNHLSWQGDSHGFDHEAIARVSDSTLVVASEGKFWLKEFPIVKEGAIYAPKTAEQSKLWKHEWPSSFFYPNYVFESLAYDSVHHVLWTIPESVLRRDGQPATPQNGLANNLRLMGFFKRDPLNSERDSLVSYAYQMDKPSTAKKAETYVMGVSELCALPDGQLLVLEREAFIPKIKVGAFCHCKLYLVNPLCESTFPLSESFTADTPFVRKRLLTEWETSLTVLGRSFANYEGMCLGPVLQNGSQVLILLSDSQDQYKGVLKDYFKTVILSR